MATAVISPLSGESSWFESIGASFSNPYPSRAELALDVVEVDVLSQQFAECAKRWKEETAHISSLSKKFIHPSYRHVTEMGQDVVPLLLDDLRGSHSFWFQALADITHENPVDPKDAGNISKMTESWINWGRRRNLI